MGLMSAEGKGLDTVVVDRRRAIAHLEVFLVLQSGVSHPQTHRWKMYNQSVSDGIKAISREQ